MTLTVRAPRAQASRAVPLRELTLRADLLEKLVRKLGAASDAEVDAHRPGGAENPERGAHGALEFVLWLHATQRRGGRAAAQSAELQAAAAAVRPAYEQTVTDALRSVPERVAVSPLVDGFTPRARRGWRVARWVLRRVGRAADVTRLEAPRAVAVYPKGWDALWFVACQDYRVRWLARRVRQVQARLFADDPRLLEQLVGELAYRYRLLAWAVLTPGPFLPYDPTDASGAPIDVPVAIAALTDEDLGRIHAAYLRVNAGRLHALRLFYGLTNDPDDLPADGDPPSWNQFFAGPQVEHGIRGEELFRRRDLPSLVAAAVVAADAREKAVERARAAAEKEQAQQPAPSGLPDVEGFA